MIESTLLKLTLPNGFELVAERGKSHRQIQVASVADFQGLERPVVLIAELDETFGIPNTIGTLPSTREALWYVALSRARNHLLLFGHPHALERIRSLERISS